MFCQKCGFQIEEGALFCRNCGTRAANGGEDQQPADLVRTAHEQGEGQEEQQIDAEDAQALPPNAGKERKLQKFAKYGRILTGVSLALLFLSSLIGLPISPMILVLGVVLGIILSAVGMKKPLGISKILELVSAVIILVVIIAVSLRSGDSTDKYIEMVKTGTLVAYPQKTVGEAFDAFLGNPKWESGISEDGTRFVNVTGKILYYDQETDIVVQFVIENDKTESFSYYACELNGDSQDDLFFFELLEAIYDGN